MKTFVHALAGTALALAGAAALADDGVPWRNHAAPFDFVFGNDFDTHQQSRLGRDGSLRRFLYVRHTGVVTADGLPVATHADCNMAGDCVVGWRLRGEPAHATFLYHPMHDHPVFQVARAAIPQPGSHAHFHWLGALPQPLMPAHGYLIELFATSRFCFIHHGAEGALGARSCAANGGVPVVPGIDIATHLNLLAGPPHGM